MAGQLTGVLAPGVAQDGEGIFEDIAKGVKKGAKAVGKVVEKGARIVGKEIKKDVKKGVKAVKQGVKAVGKEAKAFVKDPLGETKRLGLVSKALTGAAGIAGLLGQVEIAGPLIGASRLAAIGGFGQKGRGPGRLALARSELLGNFPGPRGNERQSFVPTHPLNFNRARLTNL